MPLSKDFQILMDERNKTIYDLYKRSGRSYADIGRQYGLTRERIRQIVNGEKLKLLRVEQRNRPQVVY